MHKRSLLISLVVLAIFPISFNAFASTIPPQAKAVSEQKQASLTPQRALEMLKQGNQRFINDQMRDYNFAKEMKITTKKGQHPVAIVLSCIDARSIPDFLFDQGLGNLFVSRVAGNVISKDLLGSMEFATQIAGARLVVVMGHTHCGAVQAACSIGANTGLANLDYLLGEIKPAVSQIEKQKNKKELNCKSTKTVDIVAKQNVINQLNGIYKDSAVIKNLVDSKQIYLLGAMHDIQSGQVLFFDKEGAPL